MKKWIDKRERPDDCMTSCDFCHDDITNRRRGLMLSNAQFYHWSCLLQLRDEVNIMEKKLKKKKRFLK